MVVERGLPHDLEAEKAVLGAILIDETAFVSVTGFLLPADFYDRRHGAIFVAMSSLFAKGVPIDALMVYNALCEQKEDAKIPENFVWDLGDIVPTAANVVYYARIIKDKSSLRNLVSSCTEMINKVYDKSSLEDVLDWAESKMFSLISRCQAGGEQVISIAKLIEPAVEQIQESHGKSGLSSGVSSAFFQLNELTSGFQPSELTILAARPSMGKTAFSTSIVDHVAVTETQPVLYFSLEMSKESLVKRMLCSRAQVRYTDIRKGTLDDNAWVRMTEAAGELSVSPIYFDDTPSLSVLDMKARARRLSLSLKKDIGIILIDYLQLIRGNSGSENRQQQISEISRGLKQLSRELSVPVVALSQLSRGVESREDKRPRLGDLRDSGAIEQDADVVLMLYRDSYYNPTNENERIAEIIVAKNRNGATGSVSLEFIKEYTRFQTLDSMEA